jgi:hypothetical protein
MDSMQQTAQCTGLAARWCPIHGDCVCSQHDGGWDALDDPACPLHQTSSTHAERPSSPPHEHYASLDQLAPGDRIWLDGEWRVVLEVKSISITQEVEVVVYSDGGGFTAPAALLVRRAER